MYAMFVQFTLFQSDPKFTLPPSDRIESDPCTALSSAPSSFHNIGEKSILHTVTLTSAKKNKRIVCHERANSLSFCSTDTIEYLHSSIRNYTSQYVLVSKNSIKLLAPFIKLTVLESIQIRCTRKSMMLHIGLLQNWKRISVVWILVLVTRLFYTLFGIRISCQKQTEIIVVW